METFDRDTCNVPKTQCGFIDMFARPTFTNWSGVLDVCCDSLLESCTLLVPPRAEYCSTTEQLAQLEQNYDLWKDETDVWTVKWNSNFGAVRKSV